MRKQFEKVKKLAKKHLTENKKLSTMIIQKYNTHYSEHDSDRIIDSLDYGYDDIDYFDFCKEMETYSKIVEDEKN